MGAGEEKSTNVLQSLLAGPMALPIIYTLFQISVGSAHLFKHADRICVRLATLCCLAALRHHQVAHLRIISGNISGFGVLVP